MAFSPIVALCYVKDGLREEVRRELWQQFPSYWLVEQWEEDPYSFADALRKLWRQPGDLVLVEQDKVPPPGAIRSLLDCEREWCGHPHFVGDRLHERGTGLVKYAARLREREPELADRAFIHPDMRWAVRAGLTRLPAGLSPAELQRQGRGACMLAEPDPRLLARAQIWRPSTVAWPEFDTPIERELLRSGLEWHRHEPPARHLHPGRGEPSTRTV